jgi:hypothetical protein
MVAAAIRAAGLAPGPAAQGGGSQLPAEVGPRGARCG